MTTIPPINNYSIFTPVKSTQNIKNAQNTESAPQGEIAKNLKAYDELVSKYEDTRPAEVQIREKGLRKYAEDLQLRKRYERALDKALGAFGLTKESLKGLAQTMPGDKYGELIQKITKMVEEFMRQEIEAEISEGLREKLGGNGFSIVV